MTMKWERTPLKSDMARAQGLGSAKSGTEHWMMQRITAVSNAVLMIWAIFSLVGLIGQGVDYQIFTLWLAKPLNAILMVLFIVSTFTHACLGAQVITEDYVHHEGFKTLKLIAQKLFFIGLGFACVFSILKIAL